MIHGVTAFLHRRQRFAPRALREPAVLLAAHAGRAELVSVLLLRGASPHTPHRDTGTAPLIWASCSGNAVVVRERLDAGAGPDWTAATGKPTALLAAARRLVGHEARAVEKDLVRRQRVLSTHHGGR